MTRVPDERLGGRAATSGVIPGRFALSVGLPDLPQPAAWKWRRLTDVARLESGHTPSRRRPEYWDGEVPWLGIRDAGANHGRDVESTAQRVSSLGLANSAARLLPRGTVCLSRTASIGYVTRMAVPMATSQDFVNWVCGPEIESRYLMYVLLSEVESLFRFAHGSTHQTIYFPEVKAFHVLLPPLPEQRRIAAVLGALDDKIELNRQMNRTLEEMAQALFKSWFIDFDGHDDLVESELGLIPRGWEVARVAEVTSKIGSGATPRGGSGVYVEAGVGFIRSQNVHDSLFSWRGLAYITPDAADALRGVTVCVDDVLLNITGDSILRTCVVDPEVLPARVNQHVAILRANGVPARYLHLWMVRQWTKEYLLAHSAGATRNAITKAHLQRVPILLPPPECLRRFAEAVNPLFARVEANVAESRTLATLRDTLLPKLISGEVRVPEGDRSGVVAP